MPPGLIDMTITPAVATRIAIIIGKVTASPRKIKPKIATWIGSVLSVSDGDDERALAHRDEHQRCRGDLGVKRRR